MKGRLILVFATLVGFGAGVAADRWMLCHVCTPRPPKAVMSDVHGDKKPVACTEEEIAKIQKEIDAYRESIKPQWESFRARLMEILTPEQRAKFEKHPKLGPETKGPKPKVGEPGWSPLTLIYPAITVRNLDREVGLSEEQKAKILALILEARKTFLDFSDANPPPSFKLNAMAPGKD